MALEASINGQKPKKKGQTLRFELELAPPNDDSTNEFSYAHLKDDALTKLEKRDLQSVAGPVQEEADVQLEAVARKFEEKYGPKPPKKRKLLEQDLVDRGSGYDASDSFIDDKELYEDFVPPHVDTQFGGFYINTGRLEFKQSWDIQNDDSDFVTKKKRKPKIKKQPSHCTPQAILASQKLKKAKQHVASHKAPKKALFATSGSSTLVKQAKPVAKRPKKETLIQTSGSLGASLLLQSSSSVSNISTTPSVPISVGGISLSVPLFNASGPSTTKQSSLSSQVQAAVQKLSVSSEISQHPPEEAVTKPPPVLPVTLPPDLLARIQRLEMSVAKDQTADGKVSIKAKGGHDELLADIEVACKVVTLKTRTAVMEYLSPKLCVSKPTLFKRTKQTLRKREEEALKQPLQKLKEAIEATMPEQLLHYEELKARIESTSSLSDKEKMEINEDIKMEDVFEESQLVPSTKRPPAPRKKYQWSEETRRLVCDVVRVKVETETIINRISRGNPEDLLMQFLEVKVKPLWPKGWMQRSVLYKVSEPAHTHFTSPLPRKPKKEKPTKPPVAVVQGATLPNISPALSQLIKTESQVKSVQVTAPGRIVIAAHNKPVETVGKSTQLKQVILKTPLPSGGARGCTQKLGNQQPKTILRTSPSSTLTASNLALILPHSQVLLPQPSTAQQTTPKKSYTQSVSVQSCSVPVTRYISTQAAPPAKLYSSTAQTSPGQTTRTVPPIRIQTVQQQQPHTQGMPTAKVPPQQVTPRPLVSFYSHGQHTITRVSSPPQQVSTRVSPPSALSQQASPSTVQLVTTRPTQHAISSTQHAIARVSSPTQHATTRVPSHAISSTQFATARVPSPIQHVISSMQLAAARVPSPIHHAMSSTQLATTRVPSPMQLATARVPSPIQHATARVPSPIQHAISSTQFATTGVPSSTQFATTGVPSSMQFATTGVPSSMQFATARVPSPMQLATARVPSPIQHAISSTQLATARVPSPMQLATARVPSPMQLATARVPSPMQLATARVPSPIRLATARVPSPTQLATSLPNQRTISSMQHATTGVPSPTQHAISPTQLATTRVSSSMQFATTRTLSPTQHAISPMHLATTTQVQLATPGVPSPMHLATTTQVQLATPGVPSPMQLATTTQLATPGVPSPMQLATTTQVQLATPGVPSPMQLATTTQVQLATPGVPSPMQLATTTQVQLATPGVPSPMQLASHPPLQYSVDKISAQQPVITAQVPPPVLQQSAAAITQVTRVPSPLTLHKTTPPRTLSHFGTQNQPTIKSPVDQIFEEHSYGSQQSPTALVVPVLPDREALSSALLMLAEQSGSTHSGNATNPGSGGANSGSAVPTTAPFNNY